MTAQEAREKSTTITNIKHKESYDDAQQAIVKAVTLGQASIEYWGELTSIAKSKLIEEGFSVTEKELYDDPRDRGNNRYHIIKWD